MGGEWGDEKRDWLRVHGLISIWIMCGWTLFFSRRWFIAHRLNYGIFIFIRNKKKLLIVKVIDDVILKTNNLCLICDYDVMNGMEGGDMINSAFGGFFFSSH